MTSNFRFIDKIENPNINMLEEKKLSERERQLKRAIYNELGEQKIDLVISVDGKEPCKMAT